MTDIWQGFLKAIELIISLDPEVMEIAGRSLRISVTSALLASIICIPLGSIIHFNNFRGKRTLINLIQTFFSVPTVCIGLFVFVMLSPHISPRQARSPERGVPGHVPNLRGDEPHCSLNIPAQKPKHPPVRNPKRPRPPR